MTKQVDWEWVNRLPSLAIFEAAGLSLGFELNELAPVGQQFTHKNYTDPPPEYGERVFIAFQCAKNNVLKHKGRTADRGTTFDPLAGFDDGQLWEVDPADFRRWCDAEGLQVPAEWVPRGYAPDTATPAPVVAVSDATPDPERRLTLLRTLGGTVKHKNGEWKFTGITKLVQAEKGRKRADVKTIRSDLKEAAQAERDAHPSSTVNGVSH